MKKVYQIKESEIFKIITNLISEENQSNKTVYVSGTIGQSPKYDGLKALFKKFKTTVESELRSEGPYCIINGSTKVQRGSGANEIMLQLTLEPCKEEERHSFFDLAGAIYSYDHSQNSSNTRAAVFRSLGDKAKMFTGTKEGGVRILKTNTVGLVGIKDIDPKNPEKQYTLHIGYIAGIKHEDYSELSPAETPTEKSAETKKGEEPQPAQENPWNQKSTETATAAAAATKVAAPTKTNEAKIIPVTGTFTSDNGDTAHNFKNLENKLTGEKDKNGNIKTKGVLQELYDKGINPKILELSATIVRNGDQFTTTYDAKVGPSNDGKAWMGFTARGSYGFGLINGKTYDQRADGQIDGTENKDGKTLEDKLKTIGAGEIEEITVYEDKTVPVKQYFVQFTKPKAFPPHK